MSLKGKTVLFFAGRLYEDLELWYPKIRLEEEGAATTVAGLGEKTYAGKRGYPVTVDTSATDVDAADFDGLVIPGGFAPDQLRRHGAVLRITREIFQDRKSTRLNSSHSQISYAVFCLKKNNCCWRPNVPPGRDLLRFS